MNPAVRLLDRAGGGDGVWYGSRGRGRTNTGPRAGAGVDRIGRDVVGVYIRHVGEPARGGGSKQCLTIASSYFITITSVYSIFPY